jgi:hypothetical protein
VQKGTERKEQKRTKTNKNEQTRTQMNKNEQKIKIDRQEK